MKTVFSGATVCIDDFGNEVFECRYTGALIVAPDGVVIGATMPGVKARYVMADTAEAKQRHKEQGIAFHESEANCNTCRHLQRVLQPKNKGGFLYGRCGNSHGKPDASPYADRSADGVIVFHPDDPMHMPCYASRWAKKGHS